MVNWKASENIDRLIAVLIAAHPNFKVPSTSTMGAAAITGQSDIFQLEYQAMATLFGQGATYDAIEGRFRKYRKMADELKAEAASRGITELPRGRNSSSATPRTPRGPRNGITKPSPCSSTGKGRRDASRAVTSPTKRGVKKVAGRSIMDAIFVDDRPVPEDEGKIKSEAAEILSGIGSAGFPDVEIISPPTSTATPITKGEDSSDHDHSTMTSAFSSPSNFGGANQSDQHIPSHGFMNPASDISVPIMATGCSLSSTHSTLESLSMGPDAFDMSGLYFSHTHGGYDMDDTIYGGTA
ncbi:hypothetical protein ARAM_005725 [Aspergillus rambellii]|uniref:Uncharacterized protein n=2 Tax=Aspergillus subgen. Nidulantes TaxID=2720870 RepID=A0A0F8V6H4_9EURO|nr:hypothetical protein ARAM_005725 [Aspergillus rambellii]KKK23761.1 hypothetical protein AOCH_000687 [Aspergillus ochraceoroseus]